MYFKLSFTFQQSGKIINSIKENDLPTDQNHIHKEKNGQLLTLPNVGFIRSLSWANISNFVTKKSTKNMQRDIKKTKNGKSDGPEHIPIGGTGNIFRLYLTIL